MNELFPQAKMGIQLVQQGRRAEAAQYFRFSVRQEPAHPEIWLWLAHVTHSIEEYRHCVQQAIQLAPNHRIAKQMQAALSNHGSPSAQPSPSVPPSTGAMLPALPPGGTSQSMVVDERLIRAVDKQRRRRSFVRQGVTFLTLMLVIGGITLALLAITPSLIDDNDDSAINPNLRVNVAPLNRDTTVTFQMVAPDSWILTDPNNPSWEAIRPELIQSEGVLTNIDNLEVDPSLVNINPANDTVEPPITVLETNLDAIMASGGYPLRIQLVRLGAIYASMDSASCTGLRQLADEQAATPAPAEENQAIIDSQIVEQPVGNCVFYKHYLGISSLSGLQEHVYVIYVPVGGNILAEWHLTVTQDGHEMYQIQIARLLNSLASTN